MDKPISDAVRRFVLTSIPTVPHMETLLLLWREPNLTWPAEDIAKRLFVSPALAESVADDLCQADLFEYSGNPKHYRCHREPPSLAQLLTDVEAAYNRHLREVTSLIHSNVDRKAARFAQAFTWEKK
jgi:Mn-dependent DtxR family transcriptional regulator